MDLETARWIAAGVGLVVLAAALVAIFMGGGFVQGKDRRPSTSKLQWLVWTVAAMVVYATLAAFLVVTNQEVDIQFGPNTLLAMGIATGTTVTAKAITAGKVKREAAKKQQELERARQGVKEAADKLAEDLRSPGKKAEAAAAVLAKLLPPVKPPAEDVAGRGEARFLVQADDGEPDLAKFQLIGWTVLGLILFLSSATRTFLGLPADAPSPLKVVDIDQTMLLLMGIGHAGYITKKTLEDQSAKAHE